MGFRDWWKGKRKPAAIRRPDGLITVHDERGRELGIKRSDWVASVLAPAIEKAWNDPKALAAQIVQALRDELVEQVAQAAERLIEIDHESQDALVIAVVVRMEMGDLDGADHALNRLIAKHGPSGVALTNLAKVLDRRGDKVHSRATLRRALELDPNQENGLLWWAALAKEERGEAAYATTLQEAAALPGAWRPQLWLARDRLERGDRAGALALYDDVLSRADEIPDVLMMVTGDLGNAGALEDVVRLGAPRYKPELHGPPAGMNIAQALRQLGRMDEARALVRRLQAMGWAPLAASLAALEAEIVGASLPKRDDSVPEVVNTIFDTPLWTCGLHDPDWLWAPQSDDEMAIAFSTFANETRTEKELQIEEADDLGRLTRALPLYLAEALGLRFRVRTRASMWIVKGHGPAVFRRQLDRETLDAAAPASRSRRIVVAGSLVATGVELKIWDAGTKGSPTTLSVHAPLTDIAGVVAGVERALVTALEERAMLPEARLPSFYRPSPADLLAGYVSSLEQLLYQLLAANEVVRADSLWNERGFFETYFRLVEAWSNPPESARLIAICGTLAAAKYESALLEPYRRVVLEWVDDSAPGSVIRQLAPAILKRLGEQKRYQEWLQRAPPFGDERYMAWLERVKTEN